MKLVRDKIPGIMRNKGIEPLTHTASDDEYREKLREKLQEEVDEFLASPSQEELADILEVVYALGGLCRADAARLEKVRREKAAKRGGFHKKIILEGEK